MQDKPTGTVTSSHPHARALTPGRLGHMKITCYGVRVTQGYARTVYTRKQTDRRTALPITLEQARRLPGDRSRF